VFERYTEKARRVIFFARYEASNFGILSIETEHLLLGLLREDRALLSKFIPDSSLDNIRSEIEGRSEKRERVPTSIDLPLSSGNQRILAFANEESQRLHHDRVGTNHILFGILREKGCMAADLLQARGLRLDEVRDALIRTSGAPPPESFESGAGILPPSELIIQRLVNCGFSNASSMLSEAAEAGNAQDWATAQLRLLQFFESFVEDVRIRLNHDESIFDGFDWRTSLQSVRTGLSDDQEWYFRWRLTILLADVLLKRFEQRMKS
jgi:Clp amino terminal domain, pathogenicity island component